MESFPLAFAKQGQTYQIDRIVGMDSSKHLMEIGFVNGSKVEVMSNQNRGVIVKLLNAKIALDFSVASHIYVHEMKQEDVFEM